MARYRRRLVTLGSFDPEKLAEHGNDASRSLSAWVVDVARLIEASGIRPSKHVTSSICEVNADMDNFS